VPKPSSTAPALRRALIWVLGGVLAGALYLLLIDTLELPELAVLGVAAALAASGLDLAREDRGGREGGEGVGGLESIGVRWLARLHRPLLRIPGDTLLLARQILAALIRRERPLGVFRAVPFAAAAGERASATRAALAEALGSLAPNTIVVGVDVERGLLLAHQLRRSGGREAVDVLGLG
jgi:hypothetical protein